MFKDDVDAMKGRITDLLRDEVRALYATYGVSPTAINIVMVDVRNLSDSGPIMLPANVEVRFTC